MLVFRTPSDGQNQTMKSKINNFKNITKLLKPHCATLIGGSFDPFNSYYFRLLQWASKQSRPLIVIVQPDEVVSLRRGFISPSENHYKRANYIGELNFVDYVIISRRLAHDPWCLKLLKPKFVIFQRDNPIYYKKLFYILSQDFPQVCFKLVPFKRRVNSQSPSTSSFWQRNISKNNRDKIRRRLILLAQKSRAQTGKISAILTLGNKIVAKAYNSDKGEHAEILLLNQGWLKKNLDKYSLYVLIPPCIMCAEAIFRAGIKKVYYLYNYGDKLGINYLKTKGVVIKRYRKKHELHT